MSAHLGRLLGVASVVTGLALTGAATAAVPPRSPSTGLPGAAEDAVPAAAPGGVSLRPLSPEEPGTVWGRAKDVVRPAATSDGRGTFPALSPAGFAAFATGTAFHTDPELSGEDVGAEVDMATSDAAYSAADLEAFTDELGRPVAGALAAGSGTAGGRALEVNPPEALGSGFDLGLLDPAEAKAPPTSAPVKKQTQTDVSPIVRADSLRAEAAARAVSTGCVIGDDLARGLASANDTDLVDFDPDPDSREPLLSVSGDDPPRAVTQSSSRTRLVPIEGRPGRFGAVAETRQTIAPITFGIPESGTEFTVEVGGEWVLKATADGRRGALDFGPERSGDDLPMLRLLQDDEVIDEVGLREIGGRTGIYIDGQPVGEIRLGGDPRGIGGRAGSKPAESGTAVSAAVDVVTMRLFEPKAELRVGHMEVGLSVPPEGVECPGIALRKASEPASVRPGEKLSWVLDVTNPNDCVLDKVKVVDTPAGSAGVTWRITTTTPKSTIARDGTLTFDGVGPLRTGGTKTLRIDADVDPTSALGAITNRATAAGTCGGAPVAGAAEAETAVGAALPSPAVPAAPAPRMAEGRASSAAAPAGVATSSASLTRPAPVEAAAEMAPRAERRRSGVATAGGALARTGGPGGFVVAVSLLGSGVVLRRFRRRA